jgi:ribonucleoside-diphosphate reductase alpha subunit
MKIRKRNGSLEIVCFDKITNRIKKLSADLTSFDPDEIAQQVCARLYNGIKTSELDDYTCRLCASMYTINPEYGTLASRIYVSNMHKNSKSLGLISFSDKTEYMYRFVDKQNNKIQLLSDRYYDVVMANKNYFNNLITYEKDYLFDYFGLKTLERSYLNKCNGVCIESPQDMIMRVAIGLHFDDLDSVKESYKYMADKYFTHASPTLFNAGSQNPQLLSCFLLGVDDTLESIYKSYSDCAMISKRAGGIGVHISSLRAKDSIIKGTNGKSSGLVPVCRQYNMTAEHVNQGGKRQGSIALYLEPHHSDVMEFLELKKNNGNEKDRARDLFYGLWVSDLFMQRVKDDKQWSLFSPDRCPLLNECYGDEYNKLYHDYEENKMYSKQLPARDVWKAVVASQIESGTPYIAYKDSVNKKSNQKHYGVIKSSNLCMEIMEYSDESEYACCTLASICLPEFVDEKTHTFDFHKLEKVVAIITNNLNKVIDINEYPVPETKLSNMRHRPLGIGVQGLADAFIKMRYAYDSPEAHKLNKLIFETMYYSAVKKSCQIAQKDGHYETFHGSPMSLGQFQFDLWGVKPDSNRYDWEALRQDVMKHGTRNSLLIALMPTASTSQILGNNEMFEPYQSNIYKRQTLAGTFIVVNKYLIADLIKLGIWSVELKDKIIAHNGSVQAIEEIPLNIRVLYKTIWEVSNKTYIDMAAERSPYICQSQSMNLWLQSPTYRSITSMQMYAWERGLKTGQYYLRSQGSVEAQQFTIDPKILELKPASKKEFVCLEDVCTMCSS